MPHLRFSRGRNFTLVGRVKDTEVLNLPNWHDRMCSIFGAKFHAKNTKWES